MVLIANNKPPLAKGETQSKWYLCLVETPSTRYYTIGRYDNDYKKTAPWRDVHNHPLHRVTHYGELPEMPEKEVRVYEHGDVTTISVPGFGDVHAHRVS